MNFWLHKDSTKRSSPFLFPLKISCKYFARFGTTRVIDKLFLFMYNPTNDYTNIELTVGDGMINSME